MCIIGKIEKVWVVFMILRAGLFGKVPKEGTKSCKWLFVNTEIFARILFSRIALKDIFGKVNLRDWGMVYQISKRQSDFTISRGFYFSETCEVSQK